MWQPEQVFGGLNVFWSKNIEKHFADVHLIDKA
jgi:hypothetical protein